jgi:hypothetical protein
VTAADRSAEPDAAFRAVLDRIEAAPAEVSGGYCHQCHHIWLAHDDGTDDGDHCRVCPCDGFVPAFTDEELADLQDELDELERIDPDVAAAAASYDRMVERITGRTPARPLSDHRPTTEEKP